MRGPVVGGLLQRGRGGHDAEQPTRRRHRPPRAGTGVGQQPVSQCQVYYTFTAF